ncbi:MAG: VIT domain-containing protein [Melioribacter sp.]|uniref:VIT domain-containing protein n=1 Tax=Melioribacter sp. TaxID=2052167 RepID=UPI003BC3227F
MLKKYTFFLILFALAFSIQAQPYAYLSINDPHAWGNYNPVINRAQVVVTPEGVFSKVDLILEVATTDTYLNNEKQLEIVLNFSLPEGSVVTDLWLWVGDEISKGLLLDTWTASTIYENIVNRRRDPAVLYKRSANNYELRVYPLFPKSFRKFKIQYLTPNNWYSEKALLPLPYHILNAANKPVGTLEIAALNFNEWRNPVLAGKDGEFVDASGTEYPADYEYVSFANVSSLPSNFAVEYPNPMINGVYLKKYDDGETGYYQMALFPGNTIIDKKKNKVLFLIDYDVRKTTLTKDDIVSNLKTLIKTNLKEDDQFNIFYSMLGTQRLSENWINADTNSINAVLEYFKGGHLSSYSNLATLLNDGYEYLRNNGDSAVVYLMASSDQFGSFEQANQLINDLQTYYSPLPPTYIFDFNNNNFYYYYFGNRSYLGNEYFYTNLSRLTGGDYKRINNSPLATMNELFGQISGLITSFDLYTTLEAGFCFSRQNLKSIEASINIGEPIVQIGKYIGSFPFTIKASGIYDSKPFTSTLNIYENEIADADSTTAQMWTGWYISSLEKGYLTNKEIIELVDLSARYRILSTYTSFLCLEPGDTICIECVQEQQGGRNDGGGIISVDEENEVPTEFDVKAYPNPFNSQVNISVTLPAEATKENIKIKIYNLLGQEVKTFEYTPNSSNIINLFWDGKNDEGEQLSSGVYIFTVSGGAFKKSIKLVYMK